MNLTQTNNKNAFDQVLTKFETNYDSPDHKMKMSQDITKQQTYNIMGQSLSTYI